jgi:hypothetical protein
MSWTVLQGQVDFLSVSGSSLPRRATIYDGVGDHYHVAIYGRN